MAVTLFKPCYTQYHRCCLRERTLGWEHCEANGCESHYISKGYECRMCKNNHRDTIRNSLVQYYIIRREMGKVETILYYASHEVNQFPRECHVLCVNWVRNRESEWITWQPKCKIYCPRCDIVDDEHRECIKSTRALTQHPNAAEFRVSNGKVSCCIIIIFVFFPFFPRFIIKTIVNYTE